MLEHDASLFLLLNQLLSGDFISGIMGIVTRLGNGTYQALLVLPLMFLFSREKFRKHALALIITAALGGMLVHGIKRAVDRPRPPEYFETLGVPIHAPDKIPTSRSFPSGHTETAFSTAIYLSLLYPAATPVFLVLALIVGISRIALGVHFPLDVLAGAVLGAGFAMAGYRVNMRRLKKQSSS